MTSIKRALALILLVVAVFAWPHSARAQSTGTCSNGCTQWALTTATGGTSVNATLSSNVAVNDYVVAYYCTDTTGVTIGSITANSNALTLGSATRSGGGLTCGMAYYGPFASSASVTVTLSTGGATTCAGGTGNGCFLWVEDWPGLLTSGSPLETQTATFFTTGTIPNCGNMTVSSGDDVEAFIRIKTPTTTTIVSGPSHSVIAAPYTSTNETSVVLNQSAGTLNYVYTTSQADTVWIVCAAFKPQPLTSAVPLRALMGVGQ